MVKKMQGISKFEMRQPQARSTRAVPKDTGQVILTQEQASG